jgi:hypothetical protein
VWEKAKMQLILHPLQKKGFALLLSSLFFLASSCTTPIGTDPVNTRLQLPGLPPIAGPQNIQTAASQLFSFKIITPIKNVDLFSVLQVAATTPEGAALRQAALPVGQLKEVIAAKTKIESSAFLNPSLANTLAFDTARLFNWDTEVARQVMVEVIQIYIAHRDKEVEKWRAGAEERAQRYIKEAKALQDEKTRQDKAIQPPPKLGITDRDVNDPGVKAYINYITDAKKKNDRATAEYIKQAKAAHEAYLVKLKEQMEKDKKKREMDAIIAQDRIAGQIKQLQTQSLNEVQPYTLHTLSNGDFILEANGDNVLPAVIQLKVDGFNDLVSIPIMEQTNNGRLLVSIDSDEQGRPFVRGGMDNASGNKLNLAEPMFTLKYTPENLQELAFLYPDGQVQQFDVAKLAALTRWDQQPSQVAPQISRLDADALRLKQAAFSEIQYEIIPILNQMPPDQALDILQTVQAQF